MVTTNSNSVSHDPINDITSQLKRHEGFREKMYRDSLGVPTIGYGLNLNTGITEREAALILEERVRKLRTRLPMVIKSWNNLNSTRQDVLINMAYNLGIAGLLTFENMLSALEAGDYEMASRAMLNSIWAGQVRDRAIELSRAMLDG